MNQWPMEESSIRNTACFSSDNLAILTAMMEEKKYPSHSPLFLEGDPADKLYLVRKGAVKTAKMSPYGKPITLNLYRSGDLLGQFEPDELAVHSCHGVVAEDSLIGAISIKNLEGLFEVHGELAVDFVKWMGLMHRITQTKFRDLIMFGFPK